MFPGNGRAKMYIEVGAWSPWHRVIKVFLHELIESALFFNRAVLNPACDLAPANLDRFTYHFDHPTLSIVCDAAGDVMYSALPALKRTYVKVRKEMRKESNKHARTRT